MAIESEIATRRKGDERGVVFFFFAGSLFGARFFPSPLLPTFRASTYVTIRAGLIHDFTRTLPRRLRNFANFFTDIRFLRYRSISPSQLIFPFSVADRSFQFLENLIGEFLKRKDLRLQNLSSVEILCEGRTENMEKEWESRWNCRALGYREEEVGESESSRVV